VVAVATASDHTRLSGAAANERSTRPRSRSEPASTLASPSLLRSAVKNPQASVKGASTSRASKSKPMKPTTTMTTHKATRGVSAATVLLPPLSVLSEDASSTGLYEDTMEDPLEDSMEDCTTVGDLTDGWASTTSFAANPGQVKPIPAAAHGAAFALSSQRTGDARNLVHSRQQPTPRGSGGSVGSVSPAEQVRHPAGAMVARAPGNTASSRKDTARIVATPRRTLSSFTEA
jgi:hypothetical protein